MFSDRSKWKLSFETKRFSFSWGKHGGQRSFNRAWSTIQAKRKRRWPNSHQIRRLSRRELSSTSASSQSTNPLSSFHHFRWLGRRWRISRRTGGEWPRCEPNHRFLGKSRWFPFRSKQHSTRWRCQKTVHSRFASRAGKGIPQRRSRWWEERVYRTTSRPKSRCTTFAVMFSVLRLLLSVHDSLHSDSNPVALTHELVSSRSVGQKLFDAVEHQHVEQTRKDYEAQIPSLYDKGFDGDGALIYVLAVGRVHGFDYLRWVHCVSCCKLHMVHYILYIVLSPSLRWLPKM